MKDRIESSRCAVIAGPQGAGKTTLAATMLRRAGADTPNFDAAVESKEFGMTTEPNFARMNYLGEPWTIIDCPGSVDFVQLSLDAMSVADIVILVADPEPERAGAIAAHLKFLDDHDIPHVIFVNKADAMKARIRALMEAIQAHSQRPLVLRQAPLWENGRIVGAVDLISERAWKYREGEQSSLIEIPDSHRVREVEAREALLDTLADFDDALMEQILEDKTPPTEDVFRLMATELEKDLVVPVVLGSAAHGHGVTRLLKLLRHEAPDVEKTASRLGLPDGDSVATVIRTIHAPHVGKISLARVWRGSIKEGATLNGARLSGLLSLNGDARTKISAAGAGEIIGISRAEDLEFGDMIMDGALRKRARSAPSNSLYSLAIRARNERDDVKLSAALQKILEEDRSLSAERRADTSEQILRGQGDVHLRHAAAKLKSRYNVDVELTPPKASYRETIRAEASHHARHKKQSGGHGQFADIKVMIKPLGRGEGFHFGETIHGGAVPKQFIPAVEAGVKEELSAGPLGFPVVDVAVTLYDGQFHSVDSNEMSFKLAGRQAMRDALPDCQPVLLEPIYETFVYAPSAHTSKVHGVISSRRGQILGFDSRAGWNGWDSVKAMIPEASLQDLIIELRSITQGSATFEAKFDHYQELHGKDAERIVANHRHEAGV